jgi:hypothetical protein
MDVRGELTVVYLLASHLPKNLIQTLEKRKLFVQKIVTPSYLQQVTTKTFTPLIEMVFQVGSS